MSNCVLNSQLILCCLKKNECYFKVYFKMPFVKVVMYK